MKELFERFKQAGCKVKELMQICASGIDSGYAPDEATHSGITAALDELSESYQSIRENISLYLSPDEMAAASGSELSVIEYEALWQSSVVERNRAAHALLDEFMRITSDDAKYMDALADYTGRAGALLTALDSDELQRQSPDVGIYSLIVDAVKADLSADEALADAVWECAELSRTVLRGLTSGKYMLSANHSADQRVAEAVEASPAPQLQATEAAADAAAQQQYESEPDDSPAIEHEAQSAVDINAESIARPAASENCNDAEVTCEAVQAEQKAAMPDATLSEPYPTPSDSSLSLISDEPPMSEPDSTAQAARQDAPIEYINPIEPLGNAKLPSDHKLIETIKRSTIVFSYLMCRLLFLGLADEDSIYEEYSKENSSVSKEQCQRELDYVRSKGYVCTYEYNGRRILCITELLERCFNKKSLLYIFKAFKPKEGLHINFVARQKLPLEVFKQHLAKSDAFTQAEDLIEKGAEGGDKLSVAKWDHRRECFLVIVPLGEGISVPFKVVPEDEYFVPLADESEGLFASGSELPDMDGITDDMHIYLSSTDLFRWIGGTWVSLTHGGDNPYDGIAVTPAGNEVSEPTAESESEGVIPQADADPVPVTEISTDSADDNSDGRASSTGVSDKTPQQTDSATPTENAESAFDSKGAGEIPTHTANITGENTDDFWLDSAATEASSSESTANITAGGLSSVELAVSMLNEAADGSMPSDDTMALLIRTLLSEGQRSHSVDNMHDQIVEAIVLARVLATNGAYPKCAAIYRQLNAALPLFRENASHTGSALSSIFIDDTEYTPVTRLFAYIYGMLFPTTQHDHVFTALYNGAFNSYTVQFDGLDVIKPLYHKAAECINAIPSAFAPSNLAAMSDSRIRNERMTAIRSAAAELFKLPTIKARINGIPELLDMTFGVRSSMYNALSIVAANEADMRELVESELDAYCKDGEIDIPTIDRELVSRWGVAAKHYSTRRMDIKHVARKEYISALIERLNVLRDWLTETSGVAQPVIQSLRAARGELLHIIQDCLSGLDDIADPASRNIAKAALELIRARLQNESVGMNLDTMLRSGRLVIDNNELIVNDELNDVKFAEPWRMMLQHIACTDYDIRAVYDKILDAPADSVLYDNLWQLEAIGKLIGADADEYEISDSALSDAISSADLQAKSLLERLEISYAYNRISENDRERLALLADPQTSNFHDEFYEHRAFGCWRGFLRALDEQIRQITQHSMRDVMSQLDQAKATLSPGDDDRLLVEAERLITQDNNYAVAEDYIHRFVLGERLLPRDVSDSASSHYMTFISDGVFEDLYSYCLRRKDSTLPKTVSSYLENHKPEGWTTRHIDSALDFIKRWPTSKQNVNSTNIQEFFKKLGLSVENCSRVSMGSEAVFTLTVNRSEQNQADYSHPIALFGTQMKRKIEIVCLFGKRTSRQLIDDACKLGITDTFIVLLDSVISAADRRSMAQYFFTQKNVGQASFLVIDRVLALYLALQSDNERLPAMLQCTLPYTIYQPFTNGSGSTADEMFFGRVRELASIRDMGGANIVYGGRQLGKTALLERAMHLDNDPSRNVFAVMAGFKGCRGEAEFLKILVTACNNTFEKSGFRLNACDDISEFVSQIRLLTDSGSIATLRLLLDETDDFLDSISESGYDEIKPLIDYQRASGKRFKFVFAGLHNVCRAKNATENNGLFGQLGSALCVKPLTPADARNLLLRPLRYLGFNVAKESHLDTILTNTNYYPGIIQYFGYTLVQTLASQYSYYYDSVHNNPPYDLLDDQLASIISSKDLNNSIKDRLRWTLEMDERYYMLARCITVLYHMTDNDYSEISSGFAVRQIIDIALDFFDIHCLSGLTEAEVLTLLDEMEEMGILSRPNANADRFLLRRRSFIDVIGSSLDVVERNIQDNNREVSANA